MRLAGSVKSRQRSQAPAAPDLRLLGLNVRELRKRQGLSLEDLSQTSGVSRAMLSVVELGRSAPTIGVLWRIACALGIPIEVLVGDGLSVRSVVLRGESAAVLTSGDGNVNRRALFPVDAKGSIEFYELTLKVGALERAHARPPGATESIVVARGVLTVVVRGERHSLRKGDALYFGADSPHEYLNDGTEETSAYLVTTAPSGSARSS